MKSGILRRETKSDAEKAGAIVTGASREMETIVCPDIAGRFFRVNVGAGTAGSFSVEEVFFPAQHFEWQAQQGFFTAAAGVVSAKANACAVISTVAKAMAASFFTMSVSLGETILTNRILANQCHFLAASAAAIFFIYVCGSLLKSFTQSGQQNLISWPS